MSLGEWLGNGLQLQIAANICVRDLMNRDPARVRKVLERLSGMGLRPAIDDYGVSYSSLSYIMKLPVQELKIDRSFIAGIVANPDLSSIVRSTIELGHNLGMKVVAECVEDGNSWDLPEVLGCDDAQGYFMSPLWRPGRSWSGCDNTMASTFATRPMANRAGIRAARGRLRQAGSNRRGYGV